MATPYKKIDTSFLEKITDSYLASLEDESLKEQLNRYRNNAVSKFKKCKKDLSLRDEDGFMETLTDEEIEIIANLMVVEWLRPQINSLELIRQTLGSKDFQLYSQANHLKELKGLRNDAQVEASRLITSYTFSAYSLDDLNG